MLTCHVCPMFLHVSVLCRLQRWLSFLITYLYLIISGKIKTSPSENPSSSRASQTVIIVYKQKTTKPINQSNHQIQNKTPQKLDTNYKTPTDTDTSRSIIT